MGEFLGSMVGWYILKLLILRKEGMNELLIVALLSMRIISGDNCNDAPSWSCFQLLAGAKMGKKKKFRYERERRT